MKSQIELKQAFFSEKPFVLFHNDEFEVTLFRYDSGIEAVTIKNSRGEVTLLPYMGQIIWDGEKLVTEEEWQLQLQEEKMTQHKGV